MINGYININIKVILMLYTVYQLYIIYKNNFWVARMLSSEKKKKKKSAPKSFLLLLL